MVTNFRETYPWIPAIDQLQRAHYEIINLPANGKAILTL